MSDRDELRDLVTAYAQRLDRRQFEDAARLFTEDGSVTHLGRTTVGRAALALAFAGLERYDMTTHFVGQQAVDIVGERAKGETYCLAHHLDATANRVMSIRYQDAYVRDDAGWLIASRELIVDWEERRPR